MAEIDWSLIDGGLAATQIARGVTAGFTPPSGGGVFTLGFNSLSAGAGVAGFFINRTNFAPLLNAGAVATGGSIRFAVKRLPGAGPTSFSPFAFLCLRAGTGAAPNPSVSDTGYLLGLEDQDPHRIVFRKGTPALGMLATAGASLRASTLTFPPDTWHHLRMDVIVNPNGDVVVRFFRNLLTGGGTVTAPVWVAIDGMTDFIDDALGITTGSSPLSGGFAGFAFQSAAAGRRALFDHVAVFRQT